jgi:TPR repeat protein
MRLHYILLLFACSYVHAQSYPQGVHLDFNTGVQAAEEGNYAEAYCIWKPLADQGHAEAQYRLGWLYAKGLGLAVNESTAIDWWQKAAMLGHADSMFRLGWAYEYGEGADKDIPRAVEYYLAAAAQGQEDAVEILQLMLMRENKEVTSGVVEILKRNPGSIGELRKISVERANIRKGSSKNAALVSTLNKDAPLVVLGNRGKWLRVWLVNEQQLGWIFQSLVSGYE